ncbi:MAG: hypothetical protein H0V51_23505 [Chloroflexi bacterium]|nr:hypothetical protein [Chloroflexota bacterium]
MAVRDSTTRREVPAEIQAAIERGLVTQAQLRELIEIEAEQIGLNFDEAVRRAHQGTLPENEIGIDLEFLVRMLAD